MGERVVVRVVVQLMAAFFLATCGAQAQVTFKPLEGRQVFCQACYRARKGTTTPEQVEVATSPEADADVGIVE